MTIIHVHARRFTRLLQYALIALALTNFCPSRVMAQENHQHMTQAEQSQAATDQQAALIKVVRQATERFKDVSGLSPRDTRCNSAVSAARTPAPWGSIT